MVYGGTIRAGCRPEKVEKLDIISAFRESIAASVVLSAFIVWCTLQSRLAELSRVLTHPYLAQRRTASSLRVRLPIRSV